ncbi:endolytic transglycosylase MltG [Streptomyces sp. NPDC048338]|uniref:endolytic transglycosylase MltG n=1 Tax=Streptomyces sp. NPDC048338 TaxID=3365536 RepID=UPI00371AB60F
MTEYGRGSGSEPWHPEDPLYGDQGWGGQQQQYPQQAQYDQQDPYGQGQAQGQGQPQGQAQGYHPQYQQPQHPEQQAYQQHQQYNDAQYNDPRYADPAYGDQTYGGQQQGAYGHQQGQQGQGYDTPGYPAQQYDTSWETGQAAMPYGVTPADPYGGQSPDLYGTPEAYPPPQPPGRRQAPPARPAEPEPATDWDAEVPEEEKHPFFTGEDDGDDEYDDDPAESRSRTGGRERRGKDKGKKKSRNGCACLVVALVLAGGVGGVGYFGYQFWQGQFGAAPDFAGAGSGSVEVEIPKGAGGYEIGNILKRAGVVKSVDAFVSAQGKNAKGNTIQAGVYTLKKEMSAESAVSLMLNPASQANFVIPEGRRNVWVYEQIDKKLELEAGTTQGVAKAQAAKLGLPAWAAGHSKLKDPLEGFLFPASYPVAKGQKPEDVLRKMVARANQEYAKFDLEAKAKELGVKGPWELVTIASLVQAEGTSHDDFRKMGEVVYNRLKPGNVQTNGMLEFDSTYNYVKNQSKLDLSLEELRKYDNPYNTYYYRGLPPGPIGNPGAEAMQGVVNPTHDGWYYFISLDGKSSKFTKTNAEHQKLVEQFNKSRKN